MLPLFFLSALELERETEADDSCDRWPRRLPLLRDEADELERDGLGGASVSLDAEMGGGDLAVAADVAAASDMGGAEWVGSGRLAVSLLRVGCSGLGGFKWVRLG